MHDINSCKHGLCWNVLVNTNNIFGVISQTFFFLNNNRAIFLASMAWVVYWKVIKKLLKNNFQTRCVFFQKFECCSCVVGKRRKTLSRQKKKCLTILCVNDVLLKDCFPWFTVNNGNLKKLDFKQIVYTLVLRTYESIWCNFPECGHPICSPKNIYMVCEQILSYLIWCIKGVSIYQKWFNALLCSFLLISWCFSVQL